MASELNVGGINGTLGATTPATVAATTISATGLITASASGMQSVVGTDLVLQSRSDGNGPIFIQGTSTYVRQGSAGSYVQQAAFSSTGLAVTGNVTAQGGFVGVKPTSGANTGIQSELRLFGHESVAARYASISCTNTGGTDQNALTFFTNSGSTRTEQLRLDEGGLATFSSGINVGNVASAAADTLDGYKEGTFTVTTDSDATGALTSETGEYTRIGNCVFVRVAFWVGTNFTSYNIGGLPYNAVFDSGSAGTTSLGTCLTSSSTSSPIIASIALGTPSKVRFYSSGSTASTHTPNTTNAYYRLEGFYYTTDAF